MTSNKTISDTISETINSTISSIISYSFSPSTSISPSPSAKSFSPSSSISPSPSAMVYSFTNSFSPSSSISPSVSQSQNSSLIPPLINPCVTHIPVGSNYIIIERDYLYTAGITVLVLFFSTIYYTNWIYAKYDIIRKLHLTTIRINSNPINNVV